MKYGSFFLNGMLRYQGVDQAILQNYNKFAVVYSVK
jgi:hypothetical protein